MRHRDEIIEKHTLQIQGRRVRLYTAPPAHSAGLSNGDKPLSLPLLMVHGLGCDGTVWEPTVREIGARGICCPTLAPDMPGYGWSESPHRRLAMGIDELADWLVALMDARNVSRAHVIGNSMGCQVALALARRHPDRVGAVVVQGPTTGAHVPLWRYIVGLTRDGFREPLLYNWRLAGMYIRMGLFRYFATVREMVRDNPFRHADAVRAPVLVIRGGRDAIVSDRVARELAAALPDAEYIPFDAAAHAIEFNNPAEFTTMLLDFLTRAERRLWGMPSTDQEESQVRTRSQSTASTVTPTR